MNSSLLISVILTSYNYADYISQAINAILNQSLQPDEFIIIDDASTDNSIEIINKFKKKYPTICLIQNKQNRGVISCLNHGLKIARGKYIIYAAADDLVFPDLFKKSIELLEVYPQAAFCSALTNLMDERNNDLGPWSSPVVINKKGFIPPQDVPRLLIRYGFWLIGNTPVFRRDILLKDGGFHSDVGPFTDSFAAQIMALRYGVCFIPEYLAYWRKTQGGYLMSTLADYQNAKKYLDCVKNLMKTRYNDLFQIEYVKRWEREQKYATCLTAGIELIEYNRKYMNTLSQTLSPHCFFDNVFLTILRNLVSFKTYVTRAFLFIRFRQLSRDKLFRRLKCQIHALKSKLKQ
jgi:glycosyltransferase involved in cell wall biosynthesis